MNDKLKIKVGKRERERDNAGAGATAGFKNMKKLSGEAAELGWR